MILSSRAVQEAIQGGQLIIDPPPPMEHYSPTAVDLRLGPVLKSWNEEMLRQRDVDVQLWYDEVSISQLTPFAQDAPLEGDGSFVIRPRQFVLGQTLERLAFPLASRLAGRVEGRSSLARLGVAVHLTAPTVHADFGGQRGSTLTLEIINLGPFHVRVMPGRTRICQLIVERVEGEAGPGLQSEFREQRGPLGSS